MRTLVTSSESVVVARIVAVVAAASLATTARAQVPHTFTSGTPAKAAEVNENFAFVADRLVPVGAVMAFAGVTPPPGWLLCDGAEVSRTTYAALFTVLGVSHGNGDQIATFNLPDYRGRFLRGTDAGAGRDPNASTRTAMATGGATGDAVGSVQGGQFASHTHTYTDPGHSHPSSSDTTGGWNGGYVQTSDRVNSTHWTGSATTGITINSTGGSETRPVNAYVNYIIKF